MKQNNDREEFEKECYRLGIQSFTHHTISELFYWIQSYTQKKVEEALNLIAEDQGWEESRDIYADALCLPLKYPKLMESYKKRNHIKGKIILDSQLTKEKQNVK